MDVPAYHSRASHACHCKRRRLSVFARPPAARSFEGLVEGEAFEQDVNEVSYSEEVLAQAEKSQKRKLEKCEASMKKPTGRLT